MDQGLLLFRTAFLLTAATALVPGPDVLLVLRPVASCEARPQYTVLDACGLVYLLVALAAASIISLAQPAVFMHIIALLPRLPGPRFAARQRDDE